MPEWAAQLKPGGINLWIMLCVRVFQGRVRSLPPRCSTGSALVRSQMMKHLCWVFLRSPVTSCPGNKWCYIGMISPESFWALSHLRHVSWTRRPAARSWPGEIKPILWNTFFATVRWRFPCTELNPSPSCLHPSLANYLRLLELKLSRDGVDNREALRHYREVSWVFCVACHWVWMVALSCE